MTRLCAQDDQRAARNAERARREVSSLYLERAVEFRNYAISLVHDEEVAMDALQEAFLVLPLR